ncbi:hypothetical protein [Acidovorax sp.]|uniref:hypothetical protein n=1 Tax=Acidovorax sp. TaxID=1872122 RepID=UPI00258D2A84|nr:hypothetical protein [Acidovorax sp.]
MTSQNPKPKHPWVFDLETFITPDEFDQIGELGNEVDDIHNCRHERMPDSNDRHISSDSGGRKREQQQEEKRHEGSQHNQGQ